MAWAHSKKPEMVVVNRKLAEKFAAMEPAPNDRKLRDGHCKFITNEIANGTFRLADFAEAKCVETGKTYRVNGKHTATVLAAMNGEFPTDLYAVVESYECDTLEDVASLYATFDKKTSARSNADINRLYQAACPTLEAVPQRLINASVTGIAYSIWEDSYYQQTAETRAALLIPNESFVAWVNALLEGDKKATRHLCRASVVAAMYRTHHKAKRDSSEFWTLVRDESHPSNKHPSRVLAKWLLTHAVKHRDQIHNTRYESTRSLYVRCLHAWNAFRDGGETALKYFAEAKTPTVK